MTFRQFLVEREQYDFSSTHILLPSTISKKILSWCQENITDDDLYQVEDKYGRETEPHVTVLYGLLDSHPEKFKKFFAEQKPFNFELKKMSFFENEKYKVLKIEVIGDNLIELNKKMKKEFYHKDSFPEYNPHVTIAYLKKGKQNKQFRNDFFEGTIIKANSIVFSSRHGEKTELPIGKSKMRK